MPSIIPFELPGFICETTRTENEKLIIQAYSTAVAGICPECRQESSHGHGWYTRCPQDLPCIGQGVYLELTVRRFRCANAACTRKTFAEQFPDWLPPYARRTTRLTNTMRRVGFEVSAESGRRILRWLRITTSGDTLLRIVKQAPIKPPTTARVVGIDDWAMKKGHSYGTIIIDHETGRVLEVLEGRLSEDIQPWFKAHPEVEIVTRDRSMDYRNGLEDAAPQAQQVADRWHLLLNLRQLAERVIASVYGQIKRLPLPPELMPTRTVYYLRTPRERARRAASRQRRLDLYEEIQGLKQQGLNISRITQRLPHSYYTIKLYYNASEFPERMPGRSPRGILEPYVDYLETRFQAGERNAAQLYREIQAKGYPGKANTVSRWLRARRVLADEPPDELKDELFTTTSTALPSAYHLAWVLVLDPEKLNERNQGLLDHIQQNEVISEFYPLAQAFRTMLTDGLAALCARMAATTLLQSLE
jgi:transposase